MAFTGPGRGTAYGTVVDSATQSGIPGVRIVWHLGETSSDANGNWEIAGELAGTADVRFEKDGYTDMVVSITIIPNIGTGYNIIMDPIAPPPQEAIAHLESTPTGAEILMDGVTPGTKTPHTVTSSTRIDVTAKFSLAGYIDVFPSIVVELGEEKTFNIILDPVEPPAEKGYIRGKVTHSLLGTPLSLVNVSFGTFSTVTDASGDYVLEITAGFSGPVIFSFTGFETYEEIRSVGLGDDITINIALVPAEEWPATWEDVPKPADWPAELDPEWKLLAGAVLVKDPILIKNLIVNLGTKGAAGAAGIAAVLKYAAIASLIMAILGTYPFAGFINEEALQTIDMAVYQAQVNKQWDLVAGILAVKEAMLNEIRKPEFGAYIPVANVLIALQRYFEASFFKLGIDKEILTRKIENVQQPQPGNIIGYAEALDAGLPTTDFEPIPWGLLIINSNASPAEFDVPGFGWSGTSPYQWEVPPGTYTVEVRSPGYLPSSKSITVNPYETKTEDFFLTKEEVIPDTGFVTISSVPIGAKIYMDGTFLFEYTDTTIKVPVGLHTFTLKLADYQDASTEITVEKDITASWHEAMELIVAEEEITLTINSIPPGAKIYIDDVYKFEITDTTIKAPAGLHKITLKLEGYKDHNLPYDWPAGSVKTLLVTLELLDGGPPVVDQPADEVVIPLEPVGEPTFNSWKVTIRGTDSVTGADVSAWILIDDVFKGVTTPAVFYLAPESTYNMKLRLSGYRQGEATYTTQPLPAA